MTRRSGQGGIRHGTAPHKELFRVEDLSLQWREMRKAGAGLQNLGNTCFMNSVLQSLVHTPPLAELLLLGGSGRLHNGAVNGCYPIQLAQELVSRSLAHTSRTAIPPLNFAKALRRISRSFRPGRQEDAHEFLIALLDAMHEASIAGMSPKPPPELAQTSFIYRIFGGRMRSQVKCCECGYESNTYDPCIDLSLEISRAPSVKRALEHFTKGEVLDGGNKYKCPRQGKAVRAVKRMTVDAAPNVLMIQLKRFEFSFSGHKISKKVDFDLELDLGPYMSAPPPPGCPALYDLYAVLVHSGHSVHSGHYYAYVRAPNGMWHICDDTHVAQVAERQVMAQKAYILFYLKRQLGPKRAAPHPSGGSRSTGVLGPMPAMAPAPRQQDVQQQQQQQQNIQKQHHVKPVKLDAVPQHAAAPAVGAAATSGGKKRKRLEAEAVPQQQHQDGHQHKHKQRQHQPDEENGRRSEPTSLQQQQQQQQEEQLLPLQNGRVSKKQRRARQHSVGGSGGCFSDGDAPLLSPVRPRLLLAPSPLAALAITRRGARLAELLSVSRHGPTLRAKRLLRQKGRLKTAAAAAATVGTATLTREGGEAAAAREDSPASSAPGGSAGSPVVSAPEWPPVKQQGSAAAADVADSSGVQQQQPRQRQRHPKVEDHHHKGGRQQREQEEDEQLQQQQQQQQQVAAASLLRPPLNFGKASGGVAGGHAQADGVKAFLHGSSGSGLRLQAWEGRDAAEKKLQAQLLRKEAPKRRLQDDYDLEYDKGRTKKVRNKQNGAGEDGEDGSGGGGIDGETFDAAWRQKQRDGVQTQVRGNRKRRSAEYQQQQRQNQHRQHLGGGRGRGRGKHGGMHGGRHGSLKRHSFGAHARHGGKGGRTPR